MESKSSPLRGEVKADERTKTTIVEKGRLWPKKSRKAFVRTDWKMEKTWARSALNSCVS